MEDLPSKQVKLSITINLIIHVSELHTSLRTSGDLRPHTPARVFPHMLVSY